VGAHGLWTDRHGHRYQLPRAFAYLSAQLGGDGLYQARLRATLDHGNSNRDGNEERAARVAAPRVRLGYGDIDAGRKRRYQAAFGQKANGR